MGLLGFNFSLKDQVGWRAYGSPPSLCAFDDSASCTRRRRCSSEPAACKLDSSNPPAPRGFLLLFMLLFLDMRSSCSTAPTTTTS